MPDTQGLGDRIEEKLRQANTIIFKRGRSILTGMNISSPQFNALLTLQEFGPLTMGELCKHLFMACSTATDLADRLERGGLVERRRDDRDRRVVRMHLLPAGEDVVKTVIQERQHFLAKVLQVYTKEQYDNLLHTLEELAEQMEVAEKEGEN